MMNSILEFMSSTTVVLCIGGIVLLLSLWLIIAKIKYQKEQYEKRHIHRQYTGRKEDD
ncbi:MAG: hypothetical protein SO042_03915 [Bulleidia sp.]|nr:hypothetical protein [Bulleidia sp.]